MHPLQARTATKDEQCDARVNLSTKTIEWAITEVTEPITNEWQYTRHYFTPGVYVWDFARYAQHSMQACSICVAMHVPH